MPEEDAKVENTEDIDRDISQVDVGRRARENTPFKKSNISK